MRPPLVVTCGLPSGVAELENIGRRVRAEVAETCDRAGIGIAPDVEVRSGGSRWAAQVAIGGVPVPVSARRLAQAIRLASGRELTLDLVDDINGSAKLTVGEGQPTVAYVVSVVEHALFVGFADVWSAWSSADDADRLMPGAENRQTVVEAATVLAGWGLSPRRFLDGCEASTEDPHHLAAQAVRAAGEQARDIALRCGGSLVARLVSDKANHHLQPRPKLILASLGPCLGVELRLPSLRVHDDGGDTVRFELAGRLAPRRRALRAGVVARWNARPLSGEVYIDSQCGRPMGILDVGDSVDPSYGVHSALDLLYREAELDAHGAAALWPHSLDQGSWRGRDEAVETIDLLVRSLASERATTRFAFLLGTVLARVRASRADPSHDELVEAARRDLGTGSIGPWPLLPDVAWLDAREIAAGSSLSDARSSVLARHPEQLSSRSSRVVIASDDARSTVSKALRPLLDSVIVTCPAELRGSPYDLGDRA